MGSTLLVVLVANDVVSRDVGELSVFSRLVPTILLLLLCLVFSFRFILLFLCDWSLIDSVRGCFVRCLIDGFHFLVSSGSFTMSVLIYILFSHVLIVLHLGLWLLHFFFFLHYRF